MCVSAKTGFRCAAVLWLLFCFCCPAGRAAPVRPDSGLKAAAATDRNVVRACVIGGMTLTGLWDHISRMFEAKTGCRVVVVATGPRPKIAKPFRAGLADLLVMHSGDITTDLVIGGYGVNMRGCARNDLVLLGPAEDPARVRGLKDGAEALRRIAGAKANYLDGMGIGMREMAHKLWKKSGIKPVGPWVLKDEAPTNHRILSHAANKKAYVVFGRMPVVLKKVPCGNLEILVAGDPDMRRPYVVMEANPRRFPDANHAGARAFSDYLLSEEVQTFMAGYGKDRNGGYPFFYPVWPYDSTGAY